MIGIEQADAFGDDAVAVVIGVAGPGDIEFVLQRDEAGHGIGRGAIHADFAVPIERHEAEGGIDEFVDDGEVETVVFGDARPVSDTSAAEGIDTEDKAGTFDGFHIDDGGEVIDVSGDEIIAVGGGGEEGFGIVDALDAAETLGQKIVGEVFDPFGGGGVGGAAGGGVVFEAAIFGRVVGRGDDDAVGEAIFSVAVVGEDGVRERRGGSVAAVLIDHGFDAVGSQDFKGADEGGFGKSVGVCGEEERAGGALLLAVVADGLGDSEDVVFVERGGHGRAAVAGGAEGDALGGDGDVGLQRVVIGDQARDVGEMGGVGQLASAFIN